MNKQELIKKIAGSPRGWLPTIENIINEVDREGWLRNPGEPIDPNNIRKGDRVRIVSGRTETQLTADGPRCGADEYFLLDRPKPKPAIEFAREIMRFESGDPDVMSIPHWAVNMAMYLMDAGYVKAPGGDDEH